MNVHSRLVYQGVSQSILDWALDYGIPPSTIIKRLANGWSVGCAIVEPIQAKPGEKLTWHHLAPTPSRRGPASRVHLTVDGISKPLVDWAKDFNIHPDTLRVRIKRGMSPEDALRIPLHRGKAAPGVVSDFATDQGTGGGRSAQDTSEISFSKETE